MLTGSVATHFRAFLLEPKHLVDQPLARLFGLVMRPRSLANQTIYALCFIQFAPLVARGCADFELLACFLHAAKLFGTRYNLLPKLQ